MRLWMLILGVGCLAATVTAAEDPEQPAGAGPALIVNTSGRSLFDLIQENRRDEVSEFLDAHPESLGQRSASMQYPLHAAISLDRFEIALLLIERGADVNSLDGKKLSALLLAAQKNNLALAQAILEKKPNVDQKDTTGQTALHYAARAGNQALVDALLQSGASLEIAEPGKGWIPPNAALAAGYEELAQRMIQSGIDEKRAPLFHLLHENQFGEWSAHLDAHPLDINVQIAGAWSLLHQAVLEKRTDFIKYLLEHNFDTLMGDFAGRSALHIAAQVGDVDVVVRLIQNKADPRAIDKRGLAPLSLAIRGNNLAVAEILLVNGGDLNILDGSGRTPVFELATCNDALADLLMRHQPRLNVRDPGGRTVLYSVLNDPKRTALLLAHGAAANVKDKTGKSLLHEAAIRAPGEVVAQLIKARVPLEELDSTNSTALHIAANRGNVEAARALIEAGCNINALDKTGSTPLHYAVYSLPLTDLLLQRHALCDVLDSKDRWTPLDVATRAGDADATALLQAHYEMLAAAAEGDLVKTKAVYAAVAARKAEAEKSGRSDAARILGGVAASLNECRNRDGRTPLMLAAANGHREFVAALIPAGADLSVRDLSGATPLMLAAQGNHAGVMQLFLQKKADVNIFDAKNQTALHKAAEKGQLDAVKLLLATAVDREVKDADGHTAADLATINKHLEVVKLLMPADGTAKPEK